MKVAESVAQAQCACCKRNENVVSALRVYWSHTENADGRSESESRAYCGPLYKATWCHGFHIFSAISLRFVKMFKVQERTAVAG